VEAHQHDEEVEKAVSDLVEGACKDGEEATEDVRECDELRQWDAEVRQ
jgi:hypothetical protein